MQLQSSGCARALLPRPPIRNPLSRIAPDGPRRRPASATYMVPVGNEGSEYRQGRQEDFLCPRPSTPSVLAPRHQLSRRRFEQKTLSFPSGVTLSSSGSLAGSPSASRVGRRAGRGTPHAADLNLFRSAPIFDSSEDRIICRRGLHALAAFPVDRQGEPSTADSSGRDRSAAHPLEDECTPPSTGPSALTQETSYFDEGEYSDEEDLQERRRRIGVGLAPGGVASHASRSRAAAPHPNLRASADPSRRGPSPPASSHAYGISEKLASPPYPRGCSASAASSNACSSDDASPRKLIPVSEYCKLPRRFLPGQEAEAAFDLAVKFEALVSLRLPRVPSTGNDYPAALAHLRPHPACSPSRRWESACCRAESTLPTPAGFGKMLGEAISIAKANADILPVSALLSIAHAAARLGVEIYSFASALRRRAIVLLPEIKNPAAFVRLLQDLEKLGGLGDRHFVFFRDKVKETLQASSSRCSLFGTTMIVHLLARHRLRDEELLILAFRRFARSRQALAAAVRDTPSLLAALPLALSRLEVPTLAAAVLDNLLSGQAPATLSQLSIHELSNLAYAITCVSTHSQISYRIGPLHVDDGEVLQFLQLAREKQLMNLVHVSQVQKRVGRLLFDEGLFSQVSVEFPLGPYVLDFAIPSRRLVVEVDGEAHFFFGTTAPTAQTRMKRELLTAMGWSIVVVPQELWRNKRKGKIKEFVARKVREGLELDTSKQ
ncbi:RAP domain-containing protein [Besnoitia besnoiti]|uniref:RAP domain-containing protein n=1 Tax=Besnoitia besnoiti TaxID=94643 RepID=A0A2A9MJ66_BESBE|nr:RAP domain-containing protein [Besnoitia besnoiti]PFH35637.1 RAP domain-containing protein [Besnoitia besnoiti]